ncbi:5'/3'-nucleotidase SurE [Bacillus thermotolerans]|uniref:5'-nucleotidase n=1 Tax=Bacillus thermotolerans TaxID=1221996 RepID=A0A0F5HYE4_BACTR|nr:5'/3'-nucleotidase SurE [Bacillus thermotolerans]KKB38025.1 hypothetical protein QY97_03400 [Bacillus thermotolerans]KKB40686.1 hypothetical protein QY95_01260 [Bacillus thermotolerans]KKB43778.1 hypothetical protein QY96_00547 [Bacillus thermotolerans]
MRILVANDESVFAAGGSVLTKVLQHFEEARIVHAGKERWGANSIFTVRHLSKASEGGILSAVQHGWTVNETTADCMKRGLKSLLTKPPNVQFPGIHRIETVL